MKAERLDFINGLSLCRVPLQEALDNIAYYKSVMEDEFGLLPEQILKAFAVRHEDVVGALEITLPIECKYWYFRVYFGMLVGSSETNDMKLYLVPVDDSGCDVIPFGEIGTGIKPGQYVYDFNTPCPNTCDPTSPLFNA